MFAFFKYISLTRGAWKLLFISCIIFELCALFFQHGLQLSPCVMCIYERVALTGVLFSAALGMLAPHLFITRSIAIVGWLISAAWGLLLSIEHIGYQFPDPNQLFGKTCELLVNFPSWAPLNKWLPWMFEAQGSCSEITWRFLDYTMPQWLALIFGGMLLAAVIVAIAQFTPFKSAKTAHNQA
ncbi:MAG: disulfide bond formation protein DsbB [Vibrionaceae bacterium]